MRPVQQAELTVSKNRVEYARQGLTEWYVNDERGLEQGFTLHAAPKSEKPDHDSWVVLKMDLYGNVKATLDSSAGAVDFTTAKGARIIQFGHLQASDATGRKLPAKFALAGQTLDILVDANEAVYPIIIDPLATSPGWTAESNQAYALFGNSVGTAGDVNGDGYSDVIVGAYQYDNGENYEGRVYVYYGSASGLSITANWTAEGNQDGARFGCSASTAGDVNGDGYSDVIVGASGYENGEADEGRAFVYHGSASGLSTTADWTAESNQDNAKFGISVGTAGDVNGDGYSDVIVGTHWYDNGEADEGGAFVYYGSESGLSTTPDWTAESDRAYARFGSSVGTAGDVNGDGYSDVIVGAYTYNNGESAEGRAFVYHGSASGLSTTADWTAESDQAYAEFGYSAGTAGDVNGDGYSDVIVGAPYYDNGESDEGGAFVYHGSASGLSTTPDWTAESDQAYGWLGWSVGTAGDVNGDGYSDIIVGVPGYENGETNEGRAYVYHGSSSGLATTADWMAESDEVSVGFGVSVGTAGDVDGDGYSEIVVGATGYSNGQTDEGAAFVFHGSASGVSTTAGWTVESDQAAALFGYSVGTAGDVNGDGYSDVIVGAPDYDNDQYNEGRVYVYHGSASGLSTTAAWIVESDQASAYFGTSVGTAGDVNGDGYSDVIVGAWSYDNDQPNEGMAYVYYGSASGLSTTADWTAESDQSGSSFGRSVGTAGDVNGDGYSDVIVGAWGYDNGESNEGRAFVYHGSASGLSTTAAWTAESDQASAYFGYSVGTAGDVNGDGYGDVVVGAHYYDNPEDREGMAFVYHGSASGLSTAADWTAEGDQAAAGFGTSVGTAGDVNGDGYSDIIVGASNYSNGESAEGKAFVYHGSASGLTTTADWTAEGDQEGAQFGHAVGTAGDVNGDGYSDVIVGAYTWGLWPHHLPEDEGKAFVYHGSASGLSSPAAWTAEGNQTNAYFGYSVGTSGDVSGDGYSDIIVGARNYSNGESAEGKASVYYGNNGAGLSLNARQRRYDDSAPIAHLGKSDAMHEFRLAALGRTPYGCGKVKLEWEVKPLGTLFDGLGTDQSAAWMDTGTAGVEINETVSSLSANTVYHWRLRLLYDPVTTPFQSYSRWLTMPYNGLQEADLRTKLVADFTASPTSGGRPLEVTFTDASTPEGEVSTWEWDFDNNGTVDSYEQNPTHTYDSVGTYTVKLTITGPHGTDTEIKTDYIQVENRPPVLDPIGDKSVDEGQLLQFTVTASDPNGDTLTYSASNLPSGASFDPDTQTFSWTPNFQQAGNYPGVTFTVEDDGDPSLEDSETITIVVNDTPLCECAMVPDATPTVIARGEILGFQASVTNNTGATGDVHFVTFLTPPPPYVRYPASGWLDHYTPRMTPYGSKSGHISHTIPITWPLGTYIYHGWVGNPGPVIYDKCQFEFEVTAP